ncbi:type VII secretion protein EsaA [Sporolactobacillus shoreicorticis]|uniref:Type VII secretion protein EsaA n=1 Tax=Sporolactobacillus shoreicorticis TaxID=1923877 RepID=A0ABW5S319_9BACL|nr:type VII secretion protein EsaA [Sporolactobacillus shoreicorticis]MCO7127672.1 type VII secretion protein EsaA [Sporolactobacillus shoreicorticis]
MNEQWISHLKKWGSLALVFIVIVCISGALPRYLTPPAVQPQQTHKKGSKTLVPAATKIAHLALVNEDQGADVSGQRLNLGNQIAPLFSNLDDYEWQTVSRSSADNGLKNGDYQAVFYIPSDFTRNIFTYNQQKPKAAVISYQANPKLTAEESAKVQTEFQKMKGTLNQQFSQIYWRVISDQLSYIRGNFSDVLNKDKQYLQAMSDFYKPSSRNMAQVFDDQLNQINELLNETKQTSGNVSDQQTTLTETKNQVSKQLDALNKLSDQMNQQIQTLEKTRNTNKQLVDDAIAQSQNNLKDLINAFNNGMENPMSTEVTIDNPLDSGHELTGLNNLIDGANTSLLGINTTANNQFNDIARDYLDERITSVEDLVKKLNASKNSISAITNPDNMNHSENVFGQVIALSDSAQDLYGKGQDLLKQINDLYEDAYGTSDKKTSLSNLVNDYYTQASDNYNAAYDLYQNAYVTTDQKTSLYDMVNKLYKNAYVTTNDKKSLFDMVNDYYSQADGLYQQADKFYKQSDSLYTFYSTVKNSQVTQTISDIDTLEHTTKPVENQNTQWGGEPDVLNDIGKIQTLIGGANGLARSLANLNEELDSNLNKINNDAVYDGKSLFMNPDSTKNYDETTLKPYQQALNNTYSSLKELHTVVTILPNQPTAPADPNLKEPVDPKLEKPADPSLEKPEFQLEKPEEPNLQAPKLVTPELTLPADTDAIKTALGNVTNWIDLSNGQLTSSVKSLDGIRTTAQTIDQSQTLSSTKKTIQDKYSLAIKQYSDALNNQKSELGKVENTLTSNMNNAQQQVASIAKPLVVKDPDPIFDDVDNGFALSFKSNTFDQLNTIDEALQSISASQSAILKSSKDVQSMVNGVQSDANQLSGSWGQNISATTQLGRAIARTLGNAGEPGNRNQNVYRQLTAPVSLAGQRIGMANTAIPNTDQKSASDEPTPVQQPFLTLLTVLIASVLTGFFSYHYRKLSLTANALISVLLALVASSAIIYYGIVQYGLEGPAAIMWSVFTLGLIAVMSAWIREGYQLSELVGMLIVTAMIVLFTLPLLRNSMDRFVFQNPAADVYMAIAYGPDYLPFYKGLLAIVGLFIPVFAVIGIRAIIQHVREEKEHETESM